MTEDELHRQVAEYLGAVVLAPAFWTTFPSGSGGKARGGQLKAKGLKPGVPDILIVNEGRAYFVELKAAKGRLSSDQKERIRAIILAGGQVNLARSLGDVRAALVHFGIPCREHVI